MRMELGHISALFRYPIKSMAGTPLDTAKLGWHGVEGDRRWAVRRRADRTAFRAAAARGRMVIIRGRRPKRRSRHGAYDSNGLEPVTCGRAWRRPRGKLASLA